MNEELSAVQRKMLVELQSFIAKHGYPPTVGELAEKLKRTKASIHGTLDKLITKGFIRRTHGKARSIEIIRTPRANVIDVVAIPLLGNVPAGAPVSTEESRSDTIYVQSNIVGDTPCFALSVTGDSMENADILHGDVVIVRQQPLAEHGEIVVASVDGEVTLKRLSIRDGDIRLMPENKNFKPIEITPENELKILGRVIATRRVTAMA